MKHGQWLLGLLPQWQKEGLLAPGAEETLRARYAPNDAGAPLWFVFLGSLGALLTGLGVITLFAANWAEIGRPARAALSFVPLSACVALYAAGLWRGWDKRAGFLDALGILWGLAAGACVALVAQTYQISSDGRSFVLAWTLLLLPVMLATRSFIVVAGHYAGLLAWMIMTHGLGGMQQLWALPLGVLGMPVAWRILRAGPECRVRGLVLRWLMTITGCVACAFLCHKDCNGETFLFLYALLFAVMAQIEFARRNGAGFWAKPWDAVGTAGLLVVVMNFAFGEVDAFEAFVFGAHPVWHGGVFGVMTLGLAVLCGVSILRRARPGWVKWYPLAFAVAPVFCALTRNRGGDGALVSVAFVYLAALGVVMLVSGISGRRLGRANLGLLVLLSCILEKFVASDLTLTLKAIGFLVSGVVFFAFSFYMGRVVRRGGGGA